MTNATLPGLPLFGIAAQPLWKKLGFASEQAYEDWLASTQTANAQTAANPDNTVGVPPPPPGPSVGVPPAPPAPATPTGETYGPPAPAYSEPAGPPAPVPGTTPFVDASAEGTLRGQLEAQRQGQSQYGTIPQRVAEHPLETAALLGGGLIAPEAAALPLPVVGNVGALGAQFAAGKIGSETIQPALKSIGAPTEVARVGGMAPAFAVGPGSLAAKGAGLLATGIGGEATHQLGIGRMPGEFVAPLAGGLAENGIKGAISNVVKGGGEQAATDIPGLAASAAMTPEELKATTTAASAATRKTGTQLKAEAQALGLSTVDKNGKALSNAKLIENIDRYNLGQTASQNAQEAAQTVQNGAPVRVGDYTVPPMKTGYHVSAKPLEGPLQLGQSGGVDAGERTFGDAFYVAETPKLRDFYVNELGGISNNINLPSDLQTIDLSGAAGAKAPPALITAARKGAQALGDADALAAIDDALANGARFGAGYEKDAWYDQIARNLPGNTDDEQRTALNKLLKAGGIDAIRHNDPNGGKALAVLSPEKVSVASRAGPIDTTLAEMGHAPGTTPTLPSNFTPPAETPPANVVPMTAPPAPEAPQRIPLWAQAGVEPTTPTVGTSAAATPEELAAAQASLRAPRVNIDPNARPPLPIEGVASMDQAMQQARASLGTPAPFDTTLGEGVPPAKPPTGGLGQASFGPQWEPGQNFAQKALGVAIDAFNAPRGLLASLDYSYPLRQGWLAMRHGKEWTQAFGAGLKAWTNDAYANETLARLASQDRGTLQITGLGQDLSSREEQFLSRWINKVPGVRRSQQAATVFINKLRADVYDNITQSWARRGVNATQSDFDKLGNYVNAMTGRGNLGNFENASTDLATAMFSPRLMVGRVQAPLYMFSSSAPVRQEAIKDFLTVFGTTGALLALGHQAGAFDLNLNPTSSDFGKIRVGDTRIDPWGGYQQMARLVAQLYTGETTNLSGVTHSQTIGDTVWNFIRSKAAPGPSFLIDAATGKSFTGENINLAPDSVKQQFYEHFMPLFWQDMITAIKDEGVKGGLLTTPEFFGSGGYTIPNSGQTVNAGPFSPSDFGGSSSGAGSSGPFSPADFQ